MAFEGFPQAGPDFFSGLAKHNDKGWLDANRAVWDEQIVPSMLALCSELHARLHDVMPRLQFVPRVGGSVYRLNRDTRFSRDKSPYETHAEALLWEGAGEKQDCPGLFLRIAADELLVGGGLPVFEEGRLDRYRKLVLAEGSGERLSAALAIAVKAGLAPDGEKLGRPPRGFTAEHPRAELSKHKGLVVGKPHKHAGWWHTRELLDRAESLARAYAPLHAWLRDELLG